VIHTVASFLRLAPFQIHSLALIMASNRYGLSRPIAARVD
jgi:hypothetical protein